MIKIDKLLILKLDMVLLLLLFLLVSGCSKNSSFQKQENSSNSDSIPYTNPAQVKNVINIKTANEKLDSTWITIDTIKKKYPQMQHGIDLGDRKINALDTIQLKLYPQGKLTILEKQLWQDVFSEKFKVYISSGIYPIFNSIPFQTIQTKSRIVNQGKYDGNVRSVSIVTKYLRITYSSDIDIFCTGLSGKKIKVKGRLSESIFSSTLQYVEFK
jgi:hypothetical protein